MPNDRRKNSARDFKVRVKTARGRKISSTQWLQRQLNDPYVAKAKEMGFKSRAAFKLIEIDDKIKLLKKGMNVVDLGAAPGGWCQVAAQRCGSSADKATIVGIDCLDMDDITGVHFLQKDFMDDDAPEMLHKALGFQPIDLVMSDMAAPTTGHRQTDYLRTVNLYEVAIDFALDVLKPGGHFLSKVFRGGADNTSLSVLKQNFKSVSHIKPKASRPESPELYVLAKGFFGKKEKQE